MFPHTYFAAGAFAPAYFPPLVVVRRRRAGGGVRLVGLDMLYDDDEVLLMVIGQ
jgi:hypothetical protein